MCVCIHSTYSIVHIYILFFYSSMGGHLGCFHILVIEINIAVNIWVHKSFRINILLFSAIYLGVKLRKRHIVFLYSGCSNLYPYQQCTRCSFFTTITFVICGIFNDSHYDRCVVISHCGLDLHFFDD